MTPAAAAAGLREAVRRQVLSPEGDAALANAVRELVAAAAGWIEAVVFFGSRRTGAVLVNVWSAYDLFVVVRSYREFYRALQRAGHVHRRPGLLARISRILPPTQISLRLGEPEIHLKASIIRADALRLETSERRRDHFTSGRLFQPTRILYAASGVARDEVADALAAAVGGTWGWVRPWLPERFDAEAWGRTALEVSMSWEVRPEPKGRAEALWQAQRGEQRAVFEALLAERAERGELRAAGGEPGCFRLAEPVTPRERLAVKTYFRRSLARATARWVKHVLSFEGWLDYIVRKASRHGGERIELSERERRWPFVFLWGRFFRYLRTKDRRGGR
jgi:hypothetical protein